jgi:hypothetical protein
MYSIKFYHCFTCLATPVGPTTVNHSVTRTNRRSLAMSNAKADAGPGGRAV